MARHARLSRVSRLPRHSHPWISRLPELTLAHVATRAHVALLAVHIHARSHVALASGE